MTRRFTGLELAELSFWAEKSTEICHQIMRTVGQRTDPNLAAEPSGHYLREVARFSESFAAFAGPGFIPKGLYRYASHADANRHWDECVAQAMASRARPGI